MAWKDLEAKKFSSIRELTGISLRTMEEHYELYKGYIGKTNEIQKKLDTVDRASANQIYSDLRSLRQPNSSCAPARMQLYRPALGERV